MLSGRVLAAGAAVLVVVAGPASVAGGAVRVAGGANSPLGGAAATGRCDPVWFIGARGSGESGQGYDGMGAPVDHMASVVAADLSAKGLAMARMHVSYPAASVNVLKPDAAVLQLLKEQDTAAAITEYLHSSVSKYDASMNEGIRQAEADVAAVVGECPRAKIVMAGYSQGAVAVHDAENWLAKNRPGQFSHVAGTLLLGDPDRVPNTKAKLFGDTSAKNAKGLRAYFHLVKAHDVPDPATTANIANAGDIIGDFKLGDLTSSKTRTHAMSVHTSYAHLVKKKMVYEPVLATAANWIAGLLLKTSAAVEAPLPANATATAAVWIHGVSCPSAAYCVAVGSYTDRSGNDEGLLLTRTNDSWTARAAPAPLNGSSSSPDVELFGVSCPSSSFCVAVGDYRDTSGSFDGLLLTWSGTSWTAAEAPLPANGASRPVGLSGVSCASSSYCVAVGEYFAASQNQGWLLTWSGGSWTPSQAPLPADAGTSPDAAGALTGVSCESSSSCVAVGEYSHGSSPGGGLLLTWAGRSWKAAASPLPANAGSPSAIELLGVSCASATCVAVGEYDNSSDDLYGLLVTRSGGSWTARQAPLPANAVSNQDAGVNGVSCPSSSSCVAAGDYTGTVGGDLLLTYSGDSWTPSRTPLPSNAASNQYAWLESVSCPSGSFCVAVGEYEDVSGDGPGLLVTTSAG